MGSLSSGPSAPSKSQIVYRPAPLTQSPSTATPAPPSPAVDASAARSESLLKRSRGRFGTIETGFRGLLGLNSNSDQRKTLLGE